MEDFFPATKPGFKERAGKVAKITAEDFEDEHKRRHLESYQHSMVAWQEYEQQFSKDITQPQLFAFVKDLLRYPEQQCNDPESLERRFRTLRRKHKIAPSKDQVVNAIRAIVSSANSEVRADNNTCACSVVPNDDTAGIDCAAFDMAVDINAFCLEEPAVVEKAQLLESVLAKKRVRTSSGVAVITVITSPGTFSCPHDCYYCPNEPGQPRSYLSTEPAILRANQCAWDVAVQFWDRARTLWKNGHIVDKLEILVLGGTWSGYTHEYQEEFIRDIFYAANEFYNLLDMDTSRSSSSFAEDVNHLNGLLRKRLSLEEEQNLNEIGRCKIIGLTLETRPDHINTNELRRLRWYGCTRVQLGVQHTDEPILKLINRGCGRKEVEKAICLLKDSCFKVDIHLMPDLPTSTVEVDLKMFDTVLRDEGLQADQWKIYPCEITPFTRIAEWYKEGKYSPYTETAKIEDIKGVSGMRIVSEKLKEQLDNSADLAKFKAVLSEGETVLLALLLKVKSAVHPWIRLNRVVRDIPNPSIIAGNAKTNLRQMLATVTDKIGWPKCRCIRCREIGAERLNTKSCESEIVLKIRSYPTLGGTEYFLSFESADQRYILGFLRLRLRRTDTTSLSDGQIPFAKLADRKCALIRELHVYGMLVSTSETKGSEDPRYQHSGLGKALVNTAETIAVCKGFDRIAIIAGIGTRNYYRMLGYELDDTFMIKSIASDNEKAQVISRFWSPDIQTRVSKEQQPQQVNTSNNENTTSNENTTTVGGSLIIEHHVLGKNPSLADDEHHIKMVLPVDSRPDMWLEHLTVPPPSMLDGENFVTTTTMPSSTSAEGGLIQAETTGSTSSGSSNSSLSCVVVEASKELLQWSKWPFQYKKQSITTMGITAAAAAVMLLGAVWYTRSKKRS